MEINYQRGDIVICAFQGDYGKPRPAVVVQSNFFNEDTASITLCPISSEMLSVKTFRLLIKPSAGNGLIKDSQIMVDKLSTVIKEKIHQRIGKLTRDQQNNLDLALKLWLELD